MTKDYILAIDQGTTSTRAIVFDKAGRFVSAEGKAHRQIFPKEGWVSHDAGEIFANVIETAKTAINKSGTSPVNIAAIGITNQRETLVLWDAHTGEPVMDAIVWQCRRSADICAKMESDGMAHHVRNRTGLLIDPYFTATKIKWALDNNPTVRLLMDKGQLRAGTIDSYLIFRLTKGKSHITDYSNAARTMLFDIIKGRWDREILAYLGIDPAMLPQVVASSGVVAHTSEEFLQGIPIAGIAGDQHAALFGQAGVNPGDAKNTYGTGCFLLKNIGEDVVIKPNRLLTTIAWHINGKTTYALEGSVFNAGSAIEWLMNKLQIVKNVNEVNKILADTPDTGGAYFVPAFSGLGAPHWDMYARGTICGMTLSTDRRHVVRAVMESIAFQSRDLIDHMNDVSGLPLTKLQVDGGVSKSDIIMQFQADLLGIPVERPKFTETTAQGAALLAAMGVGLISGAEREIDRVFEPTGQKQIMEERYQLWKKAVSRSGGWI